jgi:hypothetical protein
MRSLLLALALVAAAAAQPIRLDPENPHYFRFEGKPTVLITSGEHYGAVLNHAFNYVRYLDTLHADHLNLTRTFAGSYREVYGDFSIANNTLAPAPDQYVAPWAQTNGKFDLTRWNEAYFTRLKDFLTQASRRGVVVELVLFCPFYRDSMWEVNPMNAANNVNGIGKVERTDVFTLKDAALTKVQDALVRKIVTELRGFDNLYYEICNEPYFGGVTPEWQAHIARLIADIESGSARKHLIAQNWANGSKTIDSPNPLVSLFNFHYSRPPDSVAMNWKLGRAIGNNETGFDGHADATYRIQGWDFLMAGGALYNNLDYSFTVGHEDGSAVVSGTTPGGGSATLRRQLRYLREFFDRIPFWRMQPAAEDTLRGPQGASIRALVEPGKTYAVYVHHGRVVEGAQPRYQVDSSRRSRRVSLMLPAGSYSAVWLDTKTGAEMGASIFTVDKQGGWFPLDSPPYAEDVALLVRATPK